MIRRSTVYGYIPQALDDREEVPSTLAAEMIRHCPLCDSPQGKPLRHYSKHYLERCRNCKTVYAGKMPSAEELDAMYGTYPVRLDLSPVTRKRYTELLDQMEPYRQTGNLLDVGSGSGFFLDAAHERGWTVYGTEYDVRMVDACRARGMNMEQGPLDPAKYPTAHFDVITSFEVIEHVLFPSLDIGHMASLLNKRGIAYITTPNFNSLNRWLAGSQWNIVNYPEHLNYFTPATLTKLIRNNALEVEKINTTGISISRFRSGRTGILQANVDPSNDDQRLRERIEGRKSLQIMKLLVNGFLGLFGIGDTIKVYFRHPHP